MSKNLNTEAWVKSDDQKPDFNVSVMVYIPEEDHHITVGMWDISRKWVLLDEYRVPISEVTYWMPMPVSRPSDESYTPTERTVDEENTSGIIRTLQEKLQAASTVIWYYTMETGDDGTKRYEALLKYNTLMSRGGGV